MDLVSFKNFPLPLVVYHSCEVLAKKRNIYKSRLFWLSINKGKATAHSPINKWNSFLLQEDVQLQ